MSKQLTAMQRDQMDAIGAARRKSMPAANAPILSVLLRCGAMLAGVGGMLVDPASRHGPLILDRY